MAVDNPRFGGVKKGGYMKWKEYMNSFGLGVRLGIDLPSEDKANIPDTSVYNEEYRNAWNSCTNLTLGIGQDKMTSTPLQLANAMCIIANKGYYYTPHFVKSIENETKEDTILGPFRKRHDVLTHISDSAYEAVFAGMQGVTEIGTATGARIPGINMCAKTGTAENYRVIRRGQKIKLKDNSMFVAFAPRENPKIAICVIVENAGFGSTAAGPIASILMEKYLNDTLRPETQKKVELLMGQSWMPSTLAMEQYIFDSTRAAEWTRITKDSSHIRKFLRKGQSSQPKKDSTPPKQQVVYRKQEAVEPEKLFAPKKKTNTTG
jgi:penicillin-binding protein 2